MAETVDAEKLAKAVFSLGEVVDKELDKTLKQWQHLHAQAQEMLGRVKEMKDSPEKLSLINSLSNLSGGYDKHEEFIRARLEMNRAHMRDLRFIFDPEAKEAMRQALSESKRLREEAYKAYAKDSASPSQMAIVEAYPGVKTGFLSGLFNKSANDHLEITFEARDRAEYETTGTTAALKISQDADLQEADRLYRGVQKPLTKLMP